VRASRAPDRSHGRATPRDVQRFLGRVERVAHVKQPRRALNIGEQKRDGACRQLGHTWMIRQRPRLVSAARPRGLRPFIWEGAISAARLVGMKTSPAAVLRAAPLPALFALATLAFLLPGGSFDACGASSSFTGLQLVTHTAPRFKAPGVSRAKADAWVDQCPGDPRGRMTSRGPIEATFALSAALLGFTLAALRLRRGPGWCAATGLIAMLIPMMTWNMWVPSPDPHIGYWLALLAFSAAAVGCAWGPFRTARAKRKRTDEAGVVSRNYRHRDKHVSANKPVPLTTDPRARRGA
jgi:hypothetical protein